MQKTAALKRFFYKIRHPKFSKIVIVLFITAVALISILPILYIVNNAFKPLSELFMYPPRFFVKNPTMQNFYDFMFATTTSTVPFARYLFNSLIVTVVTVSLMLLFGATCAYAFSKMRFPGKDWLFNIIIIALMFSPEAVVITRYLIVSEIGITNTYLGHILPHIALPVGVFLMKQFMDQIPMSLCESARIDGANDLQILMSIIMPSVLPAVGAVLIIAFQQVWSDVTTSNLYMVDESMKTLPYFISTLTSGATAAAGNTAAAASSLARQGAAAAAALIMFLPNFLIFAILQKSMIETMVTSGIK